MHTAPAFVDRVKFIRVVVAPVVFSALAVTAPAHATPPSGVSAVVLSKQTVDGKDYIVSDITIAPGGSTGWHTHQGEMVLRVTYVNPTGAPTSDSATNPGCRTG